MTVTFMQVFISSLLGGVLGILFLIPFRKYFVSDMHGKYPFPEATATTQVLISGEKGGSQAKPLLMAGMIGGLYDFIVATFGWWNENFTTRVCSAGEMLAEKAKLVFKVNTGAAVLGLGYIVGLKYASIICAGSLAVWWIIIPGMSAIWGDSVLNAWNPEIHLYRRYDESGRNIQILCQEHRYRRYRYGRCDRYYPFLEHHQRALSDWQPKRWAVKGM